MNYSNLRRFDIANGEGVRTSLFVSGCRFHCPGCFNSEAWDYCSGKPYTEDTHIMIDEYLQDPNIAGISFLGGDPLWQNESGLQSLIDLCKDAKSYGKNVWIWSGFTWEQVFDGRNLNELSTVELLRRLLITCCDIWVDGLFDESKKDISLKWRGSSNQRIIDVKKSLKEKKVILYNN